MKIVVAPDKFKGSMTAAEAGAAIERGLRRVLGDRVRIHVVPMADGGEGTVAAFAAAGWTRIETAATDALGGNVTAPFALHEHMAVVEMAAASGLAGIPAERRDARRATSFGTGQVLRAALDADVRKAVVGVGGSATTDGGAGFLAALGLRFFDRHGVPLRPGGAALAELGRIDGTGLDPRLASLELELAVDVDAPLHGPAGAAAVFATQKGADPEAVRDLDAGLARFADVTAAVRGVDLRDRPGAGAGGGFAFACLAYLNATLRPGVDIVAEVTGLDAELADASLCITGEGRIDAQTLGGKVVAGVGRRAVLADVPVMAFAGSIDDVAARALRRDGFTELREISPARLPVATSLTAGPGLLEDAAAEYARTILLR